MKPYGPKRKLKMKGISGCRKSEATLRRGKCLRTDRKAARQEARLDVFEQQQGL